MEPTNQSKCFACPKSKEMNPLTSEEIGLILNLLQEKFGHGYSSAEEGNVKIGQLQAKLSIMAEVAASSGR